MKPGAVKGSSVDFGLVQGQLPGRELREPLAQTPNANILFHLPGNIRTTPRSAAIHYQPLLLNCTSITCSFLYIFGPYLRAFTALRSFYPQSLLLPDNEASSHDGPRGNGAEEQGERCLQGPGLGYGCRVLYKSSRSLCRGTVLLYQQGTSSFSHSPLSAHATTAND